MIMARIRIDDLDAGIELDEHELEAVTGGGSSASTAFGVSKLLPQEAFPAAAPSGGLGL